MQGGHPDEQQSDSPLQERLENDFVNIYKNCQTMLAIGKMDRAYFLLFSDLLFHLVKFW